MAHPDLSDSKVERDSRIVDRYYTDAQIRRTKWLMSGFAIWLVVGRFVFWLTGE